MGPVSFVCIVKSLNNNEFNRQRKCKSSRRTFLVMIKLDPMARVPETASASPIYLSGTIAVAYVEVHRPAAGSEENGGSGYVKML